MMELNFKLLLGGIRKSKEYDFCPVENNIFEEDFHTLENDWKIMLENAYN